jgi:hypothetical protein
LFSLSLALSLAHLELANSSSMPMMTERRSSLELSLPHQFTPPLPHNLLLLSAHITGG